MILLWLDDTRNPAEGTWLTYSPIQQTEVVWVKQYAEFVAWIKQNGLPAGVCFDHDLGMVVALEARAKGMSKRQARKLKPLEKTGYDCAVWLTEYCYEHKLKIPPYNIQSSNPVGKQNINQLLQNFKNKHQIK